MVQVLTPSTRKLDNKPGQGCCQSRVLVHILSHCSISIKYSCQSKRFFFTKFRKNPIRIQKMTDVVYQEYVEVFLVPLYLPTSISAIIKSYSNDISIGVSILRKCSSLYNNRLNFTIICSHKHL